MTTVRFSSSSCFPSLASTSSIRCRFELCTTATAATAAACGEEGKSNTQANRKKYKLKRNGANRNLGKERKISSELKGDRSESGGKTEIIFSVRCACCSFIFLLFLPDSSISSGAAGGAVDQHGGCADCACVVDGSQNAGNGYRHHRHASR